MTLEEYKTLFITITMALILIAASPIIGFVLTLPSGEKFSELWILGPGHMAKDYPFNIRANETYMVFVGVGSYMASSSYYLVYVKFRNQTEPLPNSTDGTPSPLPALYEYRVFLQNGESWEAPLAFSLSGNQSHVRSLKINDVTFNVNKSASWDAENKGYYYQIFLELWIYNAESEVFEFHNRAVWLWLNMTKVA